MRTLTTGSITQSAEPAGAPGGDVLAPGTTVRRFVVIDVAGRGGMGVVYRAYDRSLDRRVALKLLRDADGGDDRRGRLVREAHALARVSHPNVVTLYDVGTYRDQVFLAMEFVDGETLRGWLARAPRGWREIVDVFAAAGAGLAAAHAAGVIHRDFKPDNVLVDGAGRVRVTDFGLAHVGEDDDHAIMGTPAYMPPEQSDGAPVDAGADQFSFCVALYEALEGAPPFGGDTGRARRAEIAAGRVRAQVGRQPPWIARAIARGLAERAADRHPSMDALLAELRRTGTRRRRWIAAAAGVAAVAAAAFALARAPARAAGPTCDGAAAHLAGVWDEARKQAGAAAFRATGAPAAARTWSLVEADLDRHTAAWTAMRTETCEATHVRGEQSAALLDLRIACLDDRLAEVGALVELFARADAATVRSAAGAVRRLGSLEACADGQALRDELPPPAAATAGVDTLRDRLIRLKAAYAAGQWKDSVPLARALSRDVAATGYRPLEAQALLLTANLERSTGELTAAETTLYAAVAAAEEGRAARLAAEAWIWLAWITGEELGRAGEAHRLARIARATLARVNPRDELAAMLDGAVGVLHLNQGQFADARTHLERALAANTALHGAGSLAVANSLQHLGLLAASEERSDDALALYRRARAITEALRGPEHPSSLANLTAEAGVLVQLGRHAEAFELHRHGHEIAARTLGASSPEAADFLAAIARGRWHRKEYAQGLADARAALALTESIRGPDHVAAAPILNTLAYLSTDLGRHADAVAHFTRVVALYRAAYGHDGLYVGEGLFALAQAQLAAGDRAAARATATEAARLFTAHAQPADAGEATAWLARTFPR